MSTSPRSLPEGGVTQISLHNARTLLHRHGQPRFVELYQDAAEHMVEARWEKGITHHFSGFSWGYRGEGPSGLAEFFRLLRLHPPISAHQISLWPQRNFPALTLVAGEDYPA